MQLKDVESDANYQTITRHAFGSRFQPSLGRRLTEPSIFAEPQANLPIFSLSPPGLDTVLDVKSNPILSFATIRRKNKNPVPFNVNSPYSLWPSNEPVVRNRSRSRNASIAQMASKRNSLNIN